MMLRFLSRSPFPWGLSIRRGERALSRRTEGGETRWNMQLAIYSPSQPSRSAMGHDSDSSLNDDYNTLSSKPYSNLIPSGESDQKNKRTAREHRSAQWLTPRLRLTIRA